MDEQEIYEKRVGTTLRAQWKIERLLGAGGMAAVYVGVHPTRGPEAIKILHPQIARTKDLRDRFEQEANVLRAFSHPGVPQVLDVAKTDDGLPFIAMELLEGESLADRARRLGGIAHDELLGYIDELLDVLITAHQNGIIHRDIKLDNVFIQKSGGVKVLDFGVARLRDSASKAVKTRAGSRLGTLPYMPPEQVRGQDIDERADLFAVGATMFRLLAKRRIHEANTEAEMLIKMATLPAPSLASLAAAAPASLCLVVDRALAFAREQRYPNAQEMQADVRALRRGEPPPYATARLAGALPGDADLPTAILPHGGGGRASFGDVPTVVPGAGRGGTGPPPARSPRVTDPPTVNLAAAGQGQLLITQPEAAQEPAAVPMPEIPPLGVSGRGLPLVDTSIGPPSAASSTLVSQVLSIEANVADRPSAPVEVTTAPAVAGKTGPAAKDRPSHARMASSATADIPNTLGTGQSLRRVISGHRMTRTLLVALVALIVLAVVGTGIWWYFHNQSAGAHAALQWPPRSISSCHVPLSRRA